MSVPLGRIGGVTSSVVERLPAGLARRIALAAQGFAEPRPTAIGDVRRLRRLVDRLAVVQIDSVNVLSRSHYLPAFSRLGPYARGQLDGLAGRRRELFEYWAHEASFLPVRLQPVPALADGGGRAARLGVDGAHPAGAAGLRRGAARAGPRAGTAQVQRSGREGRDRPGTMWNWHAGKVALEWLFFTGALTARERTAGFERVYDLTERVLPADRARRADARPQPTPSGSWCAPLPGRSAWPPRRDLRDYFRLGPAPTRAGRSRSWPRRGSCSRCEVDGWGAPAWLDPEARRPRWIRARALLSPFDSLIWERPRVERIFGFRYRLEIYTPAAKRVHGYYVLPFLLGDQLVARVDLKADRQAGRAAGAGRPTRRRGPSAPLVGAALAEELRLMADWLELDDVAVTGAGDLAPDLARILHPVRTASASG